MKEKQHHIPPPDAAAAAAEGLALRRRYGRGGTSDHANRAAALAARRPFALADVKRLARWHGGRKPPQQPEKNAKPTADFIAFLLAGGAGGAAWARDAAEGKVQKQEKPDLPTLNDIRAMPVVPLPLPSKFGDFLGNINSTGQTNILVHGISGQGKSTLAMEFAATVAKLAPALYIAAEERMKTGTLKKRAEYLNVKSDALYFLETVDYEEITKYLDKNGHLFAWVFLDSKDMLNVRDDISIEIFDRYPALNFFVVSQVNKLGRSAGREKWPHKVDAVIRCYKTKDGERWAENMKNRLGPKTEKLFLFRTSDAPEEPDDKTPNFANWLKERRKTAVETEAKLKIEREKAALRRETELEKVRLQYELKQGAA